MQSVVKHILGLTVLAAGICFTAAAEPNSTKPYEKSSKKYVIGAFFGATDSKYGTEATFGVEGFYKVSKAVKAGIIWELLPDAGDGADANLVLGAISVNLSDDFRVIGGAGKDYHKGKEYGVWRTALVYDFKVNDFIVSPTFAVDWFEDTENLVAGVVVAKKF